MRPLYATQFEVVPRGSMSSGELSAEVLRAIGGWVSEWYLTRKNVTIYFPVGSGTIRPTEGHEVTVGRNVSSNARISHSTVSWAYPYEKDGNILWHSICEVSEFDGQVEFSLQLSLDSLQFYIAPIEFDLKRPRVIGTLISQFDCVYGDTHLSLKPLSVSAQEVANFVQKRLCSKQRRLPIVLISKAQITNKAFVEPFELSERLAGIAEVYVLDDKWAGYALTEQIGKLYGCYSGAIRVYWPDFQFNEAPFSPIYLPERLQTRGGALVEDLFRQFSAISTFRFVHGPVAVDALEALATQKQSEIERIRAVAQESGDYEELLKVADQENSILRSQLNAEHMDNDSLRSSLRLSQENMQAVWQTHEDSRETSSPETLHDDNELDPGSVEEAVEFAQGHFSDTLTFLGAAIESASKSPFKQPRKVYQALLAMHEVCYSWRQSRKTRTPMGSPEQSFATKGFTYKPRESNTSKGKWSDEYETTYQGIRVSIEQHLALGKGGPDTCLRIHFYTDEKEQKYVVAHVGRHKTNTST
jgi:hypothetical protein